MWNIITAPQSQVFSVAIILMFLLGIVEILALALGGINDWIDGLLPESLTEPTHPEWGLDGAEGALVRFLSWLYVGRIPILMLLVLFLAVFGLTGYVIQGIFAGIFGFFLPSWIAAPLAWAASLPLVHKSAAAIYPIMPKDETDAIAEDELIGRVGTVVIGTARAGQAAEVRVKDRHGKQHYVMAEADGADELPQGSTVLLVSREGNVFKAIANPSGSLVD